MTPPESMDLDRLYQHLVRLRGNPEIPPDASVIVPVNAQGDLENILILLADIVKYAGTFSFEVILVINNYSPSEPPAGIENYGRLGLRVISIPNVRRPGEAAGFTARIPGVRAACSENAILFDADCRVPNPTALIDWYINALKGGAQLAYTRVDFHSFRNLWSIHCNIRAHHFARWVKRVILRIPTNRGSNYAVNRSIMLWLYDRGMLADEMNVGPNVKAVGGRVVYSGSKRLAVLTSGRMFAGGWIWLFKYFHYRFVYNLRVLPVRHNAARNTGRERDPIRRYNDNRPQ